MTKNENKEVESNEDESEVTNESSVEVEKPDAGAQVDYGMLLDALKRVEENQSRLQSQIAKISDAQSVLVDAGAVVHDDSTCDTDDTGYDEYVSIEQLDLSI